MYRFHLFENAGQLRMGSNIVILFSCLNVLIYHNCILLIVSYTFIAINAKLLCLHLIQKKTSDFS
jgi:hypothetical protein